MRVFMEKNDIVTVVIPVYNVQEYLNQCLESVVHQTYCNIEILLINDGSTDGSGSICEQWMQIDKRIRYINKRNEGLGPTRNLGIREAKGKYVMCIDSDDWIDTQLVEKLYRAVEKNNADIVECDFWRESIDSGIKSITKTSDMVGRFMSRQERIVYGNVTMWKMLTKKSLWIENCIKQPTSTGEDLGVYALLIACSRKIINVPEPLYHYRKGRVGSISSRVGKIQGNVDSMQYLLSSFYRQNMFLEWEDVLCRHFLRWTSRLLVPALNKVSMKEYQTLKGHFFKLLVRNFKRFCTAKILTVGSYNLTKIVQNTYALENPYGRFCFQSIISIMGKKAEDIKAPRHKNPYREFMIRRDFESGFINYLSIEKPDYIVLDFLEERHNLLLIGDAIYTYSDALQGSDFVMQGEMLPINTAETWAIWQEACLRFVALLKENFKTNRVVLVENLLAERHGDVNGTCEFENVDEIRAINAWLRKCYSFFKMNMPGIQIVNLTGHVLYFTDDNYEYGCYPWHLNTLVNIELGKRIKIEG
jgi:glycosyltransferase involved in cell wall biosynthesis